MRCDAPLYHASPDLAAMLAVTLTAFAALVVANAFPLITLTSAGQRTQATLWAAISASYDQQVPLVAVGLTTTLIIAPVVELGMLLWVLVPLAFRVRPPGFRIVMRTMRVLRPWRLVEVFLLGVVIAIVKLSGLATAVLGWGAFGLTVVTLAMASLGTFDQGMLWRRADEVTR
ncbi:MAG: paraquat-inducible protein A [Kofleriaceae bacterium]